MAITDPFIIQHRGKNREVDVQAIYIHTPTGGEPSMEVVAYHRLDDAEGLNATAAKDVPRFDASAATAAMVAAAADEGVSMTGVQAARIMVLMAEKAVRQRFES